MSRLLLAAARGARIQLFNKWSGKWDTDSLISLTDTEAIHRIHPDDEHMQYGPISTALREFAAGIVKRPENDTYWRIARDYYIYEAGPEFYTLEQRPLFLLILAEALADEGL